MHVSEIAATLRVHPRTVIRALMREKNPYWIPGYDPVVSVAEVAVAFNGQPSLLRSVHHESVPLLNQRQAAVYLKVPLRTFRHRGYNPAFWLGERIQRFPKSQLDRMREQCRRTKS